MLVQNSIGSCLQVKSSAQTGTQAAATAIPPWWVLGLPSGGRHIKGTQEKLSLH